MIGESIYYHFSLGKNGKDNMFLKEEELLEQIEKMTNSDKSGLDVVAKYYFLTEDFMEKYKYKLNWYDIFLFHNLNDCLKEKYKDFNTLDNRDFCRCYWCGVETKLANYKRGGKPIRRTKGIAYDLYYCPNCLR